MSNVVQLAGRGQPPTILLVEPKVRSRIEIAAYLRKHDYRVVEAVGGDEALRLLRSGRIAHIVLSGLDLDDAAEGARLAADVRREFPHVRLLQAAPSAKDRSTASRSAAKGAKDLPCLEHAIRAALSGRMGRN